MNTSTFIKELHQKNLNQPTVFADTRKSSSNHNNTDTLSSQRNSRYPENAKCVLNTTTIHIKQQKLRQRDQECGFYLNPPTSDDCVNAVAKTLKTSTLNEESEHNSKEKKLKETVRSTLLFPTLKSTDTDQHHHLNHVLNIKISPVIGATAEKTVKTSASETKSPFLIENLSDRKISVIKVNQGRHYDNFKQFCVNMVQDTDHFDELSETNSKTISAAPYKNLMDLKMSGQCSPQPATTWTVELAVMPN